MNIIDANLINSPNDRYFTMAREGVESLFLKSGAADCDALVSVYSMQFEKQKTDLEWINKAERQLKRSACSDHNFYTQILAAKWELDPSGDLAHKLAQLMMKQNRPIEAIDYLNFSLEQELPSEELSRVYYELAYLTYTHHKMFQQARDYAKKASELNPDWGDPLILIGKIYIDARSAAFNDSFEQTTVLWAAIDQFAKAGEVDPETHIKAKDLIETYSAYFPLKETLFFHTLKTGDKYKVEGWINEMTTVRSRD